MLEGLAAILLGVVTLALCGLIILGVLVGRTGLRLWRIFIRKGQKPMPAELYALFRGVKTIGAHLADTKGMGRLLAVEVAPGLRRFLVDVSSRGQITAILTHMHGQLPLPEKHHLVIDIGANDGFQGSQSFNLNQLGWIAVLVEPNPEACHEIHDNVLRRRLGGAEGRVIVRNVAATEATDGEAKLFVKGWRHTGSSLRKPEAKTIPLDVRTESVPTLLRHIEEELKTRGLLEALPIEPGVLSLDTEGLDFEILRGFMSQGIRPCYILVEERENADRYHDLLEPLGYDLLVYFDADLIFYRAPNATTA
jgi:FkbM family methyltransferase